MKNMIICFLFCYLTFSFCSKKSYCQQEDTVFANRLSEIGPSVNIWINGGVGINSISLGANGNINLEVGRVLFSFKRSINGGLFDDALHEADFLIGYVIREENFHIAFLSGYSSMLYESSFWDNSKKSISSNWGKRINIDGFVTEIQFCKNIFDFLGFGIVAYGNLNKVRNLFGVNLNLFIGYLAYK